ncbi:MAG: S26 family signal peptidase [Nannocystaceae bacterium]
MSSSSAAPGRSSAATLVVYDPVPPPPAEVIVPVDREASPRGVEDPRSPLRDRALPRGEPLRNTAVVDELGLDEEWRKVQRRSGLDRPAEPQPQTFRVGRVLALPGDRVTVRSEAGGLGLAINGEALDHKAAGAIELVVQGPSDPSEDHREALRPRPRGSAFEMIGGRRFQVLATPGPDETWPGLQLPREPGPVELIADGYLIIADNRDDGACCDSRAVGFVDGAQIRGEIVARLGGSAHVPEDIDPRSRGIRWKP